MLNKLLIALAAILVAAAAVSAVDSAWASIVTDVNYRFTGPSSGFYWLSDGTILGGP
jgi:hypothetical protein